MNISPILSAIGGVSVALLIFALYLNSQHETLEQNKSILLCLLLIPCFKLLEAAKVYFFGEDLIPFSLNASLLIAVAALTALGFILFRILDRYQTRLFGDWFNALPEDVRKERLAFIAIILCWLTAGLAIDLPSSVKWLAVFVMAAYLFFFERFFRRLRETHQL
ncbi:MAG: hypothetical protein GC154_11820 [bacterium]|nr:hypothetical protein [bacterium]